MNCLVTGDLTLPIGSPPHLVLSWVSKALTRRHTHKIRLELRPVESGPVSDVPLDILGYRNAR